MAESLKTLHALECAVLQERQEEYNMADSLKTLRGPGVCSVTGKAGGIQHGWLTEDSAWPWSVQCYRKGRRNTTRVTHWRLWMALECAVLQERQEEYYMADSLKTLRGPGVCSVTEKAGGILHGWLTEDSEWPWSVQCYRRGRRNTTWLNHWRHYMVTSVQCYRRCRRNTNWLATEDYTWPQIMQSYRNGMMNTTRLTDWRLYMVPECAELLEMQEEYVLGGHWRMYMTSDYAELQERQEEYYTADSLKTLHGTRVCNVTGKAGGILHGWLTEDSAWPWSVQCYGKGWRNTTWLTHWRLWMALECAVLQERQEEYYMAESLKTLHGNQCAVLQEMQEEY